MVRTPNLRGGLRKDTAESPPLFPRHEFDDVPDIKTKTGWNRKAKGYIQDGPTERSLMECGFKDKLLTKPKPEKDADLEKIAASAEFNHDQMSSKFVLELSDFVNIPVELLQNPGIDLRSRPFNFGRCEKLRDAMIQNSLQMPQFADVVPISRKVVEDTGVQQLVEFKNLTKEEIYEKIPECFFVTISGQHSSTAMNWIRDSAATSDCAHLKGVAEKYRFCQCRILVSDLSRSDYVTLGSMANPEAGKKMYDTPFVQKVEHIRSLYHYNNCPPRPKPGIPKSAAFLIWETEAMKVLGPGTKTHTPFGNVQWAIFGDEIIFKLWVDLCHLYMKGLLPEKDGIVRPSKEEREVKSAFFKNLEGDIPESQILYILEGVKDYKILFAKTGKSAPGCNKDSINEAATKYKDKQFVQRLLLCKLKAEFPGSTTGINSWEAVVIKCPAAAQQFGLLHSLLDPADIKNKNRTPAPELVTESCASSLQKLWVAAVPSAVCNVAEGHSPYHVLLVKDMENCTLTAPPPRVKYVACRLAIIDFTASRAQPWSTSAVCSLVKAVHSIFATAWLQFIFLLSPADGVTMASVLDFIFKPEDSSPYHIERDHGSFWPHRLPGTASPVHSFSPVMILQAFISTKQEAWSTIVKGQSEYYFGYNADVDLDVVPHFDMATIQRSLEEKNAEQVLQGGDEKTPRQIWHDILAQYPPHYTMCGLTTPMRSATLFPDRVARELILQNSDPKEIVIDCFSGGWVSKIALLNDRECASYATSKMEFDFLETYLPLLKGVDGAKNIFKSTAEAGLKSALRVPSTSISATTKLSHMVASPNLSTSSATPSTKTRRTNKHLGKRMAAQAPNEAASLETPGKSLHVEEQTVLQKPYLADIPSLETTTANEVNSSDNDSNLSISSGLGLSHSKAKAAECNVDGTDPSSSSKLMESNSGDVTADSKDASPVGGDLESGEDAGLMKDTAGQNFALESFASKNLSANDLGAEDLAVGGGLQDQVLQAGLTPTAAIGEQSP